MLLTSIRLLLSCGGDKSDRERREWCVCDGRCKHHSALLHTQAQSSLSFFCSPSRLRWWLAGWHSSRERLLPAVFHPRTPVIRYEAAPRSDLPGLSILARHGGLGLELAAYLEKRGRKER